MARHGIAALLRLVPFLRRAPRRKKDRPELVAARLVAMRERERRDEQLYFLHAVRRFLQASPELRSRIYVLSLSDFRETVAEKWARLGDKVGLLTRSIIHKHVDKLALFCQADDETFIMALPTLSRDEAHRRVRAPNSG